MSLTTLTIPGLRMLRVQQVAAKYGVSVRTIWRWEGQRRIPRGVRLARAVRWREDVIDRHLTSLV
jgi:predicted DNA-binding transcriptional regulator AlpA